MAKQSIPDLVKHMTIAIWRDGKISAKSRKDKFKQCLQIAKARCSQYGLVVFAGTSLTEAITLTANGRERDMKHRTEGRSKSVLFDTLFAQYDLDGSQAAADQVRKEAAQESSQSEKTAEKATSKTTTAKVPKYSKKDLL